MTGCQRIDLEKMKKCSKHFPHRNMFKVSKDYIEQMGEVHLQNGIQQNGGFALFS